jgi:hypothetical protein
MSAKKLYKNGDVISGIKVINDLGFVSIEKTVRHKLLLECPYCKKEFQCYANRIVTKNTKSCGCHKSQATIDRNYRHGLKGHPVYLAWKHIKQRCYNPKVAQYKDWGGRGITICDEWKDNPKVFYDWAVSNGWEEGLTIERIEVDGNYCPENCKWIPLNQQVYNQHIRRTNKSGYVGVSWKRNSNAWTAQISVKYEKIYLGIFKTPEEAKQARDNYIIQNNLPHKLNEISI